MFKETAIHVVYSTDNNYWMHLYVSLYSLLKNNQNNKFIVFILTDEADESFLSNIYFLYDMGNLIDCKIIQVDSSLAESFPLTYGFCKATYYRLFVGQLLPDDIKEVLYLDCDTIVNKSLENLFETDMNEYVIGAVPDHHMNLYCASARLNMLKDIKYFNAGVMLINLVKWRANNVEKRLLEYLKNNSQKIVSVDQDVLNAVLYNEYKELNQAFNYMLIDGEIIPKELKAGTIPSIIHYIIYYGHGLKPWLYLSLNPLKPRYWAYLRETPYRDFREEDRNLKNILLKPKIVMNLYIATKTTQLKMFIKKSPFIYEKMKVFKKNIYG